MEWQWVGGHLPTVAPGGGEFITFGFMVQETLTVMVADMAEQERKPIAGLEEA